jgi:hypothetical protein
MTNLPTAPCQPWDNRFSCVGLQLTDPALKACVLPAAPPVLRKGFRSPRTHHLHPASVCVGDLGSLSQDADVGAVTTAQGCTRRGAPLLVFRLPEPVIPGSRDKKGVHRTRYIPSDSHEEFEAHERLRSWRPSARPARACAAGTSVANSSWKLRLNRRHPSSTGSGCPFARSHSRSFSAHISTLYGRFTSGRFACRREAYAGLSGGPYGDFRAG